MKNILIVMCLSYSVFAQTQLEINQALSKLGLTGTGELNKEQIQELQNQLQLKDPVTNKPIDTSKLQKVYLSDTVNLFQLFSK